MKRILWVEMMLIAGASLSALADSPLPPEEAQAPSQQTTEPRVEEKTADASDPATMPLDNSPAEVPLSRLSTNVPQVKIGDSRDRVFDILGPAKGEMKSKTGWELLLFAEGEVELMQGKVVKTALRSPAAIAKKQREAKKRAEDKARLEAERQKKLKESKAARASSKKERMEKAEKDDSAWKERMTPLVGPKPSLSSKKRKKLAKTGKWYWNLDGTINWDAVKKNPPGVATPESPPSGY